MGKYVPHASFAVSSCAAQCLHEGSGVGEKTCNQKVCPTSSALVVDPAHEVFVGHYEAVFGSQVTNDCHVSAV